EGKHNSIILAQIQRPARKESTFSHLLLIIDGPAVYLAAHVAKCSHAIGQGEIRVEFDGPVEQAQRLVRALQSPLIKVSHPTKKKVVCIEAFRGFSLGSVYFRLLQRGATAPTTLAVRRSCRSKMSSMAWSNRSAQRCVAVVASISWAVMRTRLSDLRTLPSST